MLRLTDDERMDLRMVPYKNAREWEYALIKAQLQKMVEWGDGFCDEGYWSLEWGHLKRRQCEHCWAELKAEVGK